MSDAGQPHLSVDPAPGSTRALALVLHGGRSTGHGRVRANQLAVLRMAPFASALRSAGAKDGLTVARLRYRVRGWNGAAAAPVGDTRWALDRLGERFPGAPVALVGHSMGGRAAIHAAGHPAVRVVVGLAPWVEADDPSAQLAGRRLLVVHGDGDRMTSPVASAAFTRAAARVATSATYVSVHGERHPMLRRAALWHGLTAGFVVAALIDGPAKGTEAPQVANIVTKALAGEPSLDV